MWRSTLILLSALIVAACASYSGSGLKPGESRLADVRTVMGQPAMQWQDLDGSQQLAYPRGPAGVHTFMVKLGPDEILQSITNVLDEQHLAKIRPGMSKEEVLRILGPPDANATAYFKARDELAWDWRFLLHNEPWRMIVLFDATSGKVRSTLIKPEQQFAHCPGARGSVILNRSIFNPLQSCGTPY